MTNQFFQDFIHNMFHGNYSLINKQHKTCEHCKTLKNKIKNISTYDKKRKIAYLGFMEDGKFPKKTNLHKTDFNHLVLYQSHFNGYSFYLDYICEECLTNFELNESTEDNSSVSFTKFKTLDEKSFYLFMDAFEFLYRKYFFKNYSNEIRKYTEPIDVYGIYTKRLYRGHHKELIESENSSFTEGGLEFISVKSAYHALGTNGGFMNGYFNKTFLLKIQVMPYHLFLNDFYMNDITHNSIEFEMNRKDAISVQMYDIENDTWVKHYKKVSEEAYNDAIREKFKEWNQSVKENDLFMENHYTELVNRCLTGYILNELKSVYPTEYNELYLSLKKEREKLEAAMLAFRETDSYKNFISKYHKDDDDNEIKNEETDDTNKEQNVEE